MSSEEGVTRRRSPQRRLWDASRNGELEELEELLASAEAPSNGVGCWRVGETVSGEDNRECSIMTRIVRVVGTVQSPNRT